MASTYTVCVSCNKVNRVAIENQSAKAAVCGHCQTKLPLHGAVSDSNTPTLAKLIEKSPLPVVVDFWAPWCGPCRTFAPTFLQAGQNFAGQVVFTKLDTQAEPAAGAAHRVQSIPTLIVFKNGRELTRISGAMPPAQFAQWLRQVTATSASAQP